MPCASSRVSPTATPGARSTSSSWPWSWRAQLERATARGSPRPPSGRRPSGKTLLYDKGGEEHYNLISALHKSLRDSDPDGALYWLGRMLEAGEDPLYVARRLVRFASEDVGNADPRALGLALDARHAYHLLGSPEGELALAQATCYLALAPKSNAVYAAFDAVKRDIAERPAEPVPLHIRNAPTGLMANLGHGRGYQYAHDAPDALVDQEHLPDALRGRAYYHPTDRGAEKDMAERLRAWRAWRDERDQATVTGARSPLGAGRAGAFRFAHHPGESMRPC